MNWIILSSFIISLLLSPYSSTQVFASSLSSESNLSQRKYNNSLKGNNYFLAFLKNSNAATAISADKIINDKIRQRVVGKGFADIRFL